MDLSIIIVNYNTKELTGNCINSVIKNTRHISYEIILVDNASKDGSCEYLKDIFPGIQIIANSENMGFAKANNQGIKAAKGKYILLLNSDTEFIEDCISPLLKYLDDNHSVIIVGCKVLNADRTLQESVYHFPSVWSELIFFTKGVIKNFWDPVTYFHKMKYWGHNSIKHVDCISGCFLLVKKYIFGQVGLLDERFFMYYEDSEFCFRVNSYRSNSVYYYPYRSIIHHHGKSIDNIKFATLKECYKSANIYMMELYGINTARLFRIACKLIWKIECGLLSLIFLSKRTVQKVRILSDLYKL